MFSNYLHVALRNLRKQKAYSVINILGLATGIACCTLMMLYVQDELKFDAFHSKSDRIYRLVATTNSVKGEQRVPFVMGPLAPTLAETVPEIASAVRIRDRWGGGRFTVGYDDRR
jgi:putative ABC transport system permease protein